MAATLIGAVPDVASAGAHVFVGGAFGVPAYPYYPYPAYYYGPYYAPYPYYGYAPSPYVGPSFYGYGAYSGTTPPGWEPGHWEWRADAAGRRVRVWVPSHLR